MDVLTAKLGPECGGRRQHNSTLALLPRDPPRFITSGEMSCSIRKEAAAPLLALQVSEAENAEGGGLLLLSPEEDRCTEQTTTGLQREHCKITSHLLTSLCRAQRSASVLILEQK